MNNDKRIEIEQRIVRKYLKAAEKAGWKVVSLSADGEKLDGIGDLFACDEALVVLAKEGQRNSFLYFVYGNEPGEVLNDYGVSLEEAISEVNQYAEQWA